MLENKGDKNMKEQFNNLVNEINAISSSTAPINAQGLFIELARVSSQLQNEIMSQLLKGDK